MLLNAGYHSVGKPGRPNEDRFRLLGCDRIFPDDRPGPFLDSGRGGLFGVFDGVGGSKRPIAAAQHSADILVRFFDTHDIQVESSSIEQLLAMANRNIHAWGMIPGTDRPLGACTASVCWLHEQNAFLFHVGDSSVYYWKDDEQSLRLMTLDHSSGGGIVRYVGLGDGLAIDTRSFPINPGDVILLCTDGLTKGLRKDEIAQMIEHYLGEPGELARELVSSAQRRKVQDDITAVVVETE